MYSFSSVRFWPVVYLMNGNIRYNCLSAFCRLCSLTTNFWAIQQALAVTGLRMSHCRVAVTLCAELSRMSVRHHNYGKRVAASAIHFRRQ